MDIFKAGGPLRIATKRERRVRVYKIFDIYFFNRVTFLHIIDKLRI